MNVHAYRNSCRNRELLKRHVNQANVFTVKKRFFYCAYGTACMQASMHNMFLGATNNRY